MIKPKIIALFLLFVQITFQATGMSVQEFDELFRRILEHRQSTISGSLLEIQTLQNFLRKIPPKVEVFRNNRFITINLEWMSDTLEEIREDSKQQSRSAALETFFENVEGLRSEIVFPKEGSGLSQQEIRDALARVLGKVKPLRPKIELCTQFQGNLSEEISDEFSEDFDGDIVAIKVENEGEQSSSEGWSSSEGSGGSYNSGSSGKFCGSVGNSGSGGFSVSGDGSASHGSGGQRFGGGGGNQSVYNSNSGYTPSTPSTFRPQFSDGKSPQANTPPKFRALPSPPPPPQKPEPPPPPPPPPTSPDSDSGWLKAFFKLIYYLVVALSVIAFLALLYFVIRSIRKNLARQNRTVVLGKAPLLNEKEEPKGLYEEALSAANSRNFDKAIRLMTLAILLLLDEKGAATFRLSCTNWEFLSTLMKDSPFNDLLRKPLLIFDGLIYGFALPDMKAFQVFKETYEEIRSGEAKKKP